MTYHVRIDWLFGCPRDPSIEESRAQTAARRIFDQAGIDGYTAQEAYFTQGGLFGDEATMTGLARLWLDARDAADQVATEDWPEPSRAKVSIECSR